jgi:release factor glutamine methyltransferase
MTYSSNFKIMNANSSPTIHKWLREAQAKLKQSGIDSYPLDCLILVEHVTGLGKAHILAYQEKSLASAELKQLNALLLRRIKREPIAYITEVKEFYGRDFRVNKDVLIPRPESESFIELLKKHKITHQNVVDVGCGSGAIGISAKLELPTNQVTLLDIDSNAIRVAKKNQKALSADCLVIKNDLLPANNSFSVVLANLPYVPRDLPVEPELAYEPALALYADQAGMELYERLWQQLCKQPDIKCVLTESLLTQHKTMNVLAADAGFKPTDSNGLVQLFTLAN